MENLTPQQLDDYNNAETLAWVANDAFDHRLDTARRLSVAVGALVSSNPEQYFTETEIFTEADKQFNLLSKAAGILMPAREAFRGPEPQEPFGSESVWAAMSSEQKIKANEVRSAIAEQFKDYGVTADTLRLVMTESEEGKKVFTLLHAGNGIDIGDHSQEYDPARSYNSVMDKKNDPLFNVEVNGTTYDVRKGMNDSVYDALYAEAKAQGITLPDSKQASQEFKDEWTWTMLTGEPLTADGRVQVRGVDDGGVSRGACRPDDVRRSLRVRPAVVIE